MYNIPKDEITFLDITNIYDLQGKKNSYPVVYISSAPYEGLCCAIRISQTATNGEYSIRVQSDGKTQYYPTASEGSVYCYFGFITGIFGVVSSLPEQEHEYIHHDMFGNQIKVGSCLIVPDTAKVLKIVQVIEITAFTITGEVILPKKTEQIITVEGRVADSTILVSNELADHVVHAKMMLE